MKKVCFFSQFGLNTFQIQVSLTQQKNTKIYLPKEAGPTRTFNSPA